MNLDLLKKKQDAIFQIETVPVAPKQRNFRVQVSVADRDMSAFVRIIPVGKPEEHVPVTEVDILLKLYSAGVRLGIDYDRVAQMVARMQYNKDVLVAIGEEPIKGEPARLEPRVHLEEFTTAELLKQFPGQEIRRGVPVDLDEVIIEKIPATLGVPGYTVRGRRIDPEPGDDVEFQFGDGVRVNDDKTALVAAMPGMVGLSKDVIGVKDAEYEQWKAEIKLRRDNMEAVLTIIPGLTKQPDFDESWYREILDDYNIKFGADRDGHRFIPDKVRGTYVRTMAEGEPPLPGEDAKLIERYRESADPGQHIFPVQAGQVIVEKKPPAKGARGRNVLDEPVQPSPGKDFDLAAGPNTALSSDGLKITATVDGFVSRIKDAWTVAPAMQVDPASGALPRRINHDGVVRVLGSLPRGHMIVAAHHVEILGDVSEAEVVAGGILHVHGEVQECIRTKVQCGADMYVGSARRARLRADGAVYIREAARECNIIAGGGLFGETPKASVAGGRTVIGNGADIASIGAVPKVATIIYAGVPYVLRVRFEQTSREVMALQQKLDLVNAPLINLHKKLLAKQISKQEILMYRKLKLARETLTERLRLRRALFEKLNEAVRSTSRNSRVRVTDAAFAGAVIAIGTRPHKIDVRTAKSEFHLDDDGKHVVVRKFS
jgi:uncharacterized protein (DUF342 family)